MQSDAEYIGGESSIPGAAGSIWLDTAERVSHPALEGEIDADVVVVGGGLVGALTADRLAREGRDVVLVEARRLSGGATGHTTAKATVEHQGIYRHLEHAFGEEHARLYCEANTAGLDLLETLCTEIGAQCGFARMPLYLYAADEAALGDIRQEAEAAARAGVPARFVDEVPALISTPGAVLVENQAIFHPVRLVLGLLGKGNVRVFENSRVTEVDDGDPLVVRTEAGSVRARECVVATQFPIYDKGLYFSRLYPNQSYAFAGTSTTRGSIDFMSHSHGDEPTTALRPFSADDGSTIILSGVDHKTGQGRDERECYRALAGAGESRHGFDTYSYHWSTHDFTTPDRIPYIGRSPWADRIFLAAGFGGWGMTSAAASALLITDLVMCRDNPWTELFDPNRVRPIASAVPFLKENLNTATHLVGGLIGGRPLDTKGLRLGEGFVIRRGARHYAVHRNDEGELVVLDATCTHLGCQVVWNEAERTWDCPCHGSRYAADGTVLYAPTVKRLTRAELPAED